MDTIFQSTSAKPSGSSRLSGSDGIRAIACLAVIGHHMFQRVNMSAQSNFLKELQAYFLMGNTGVSIFFVLSGFLLSYPFWRNYLSNASYPSIRQYIIKRTARIMPGYYIALLASIFVVILMNMHASYLLVRSFAGFTFTAAFHYITFFPSDINGPLWSISFEVFCYIMMPLFMYFLYSVSKNKRSFIKGILYWTLILMFMSFTNYIIHKYLTPDDFMRGWQYGNIGGAKYWMPNYNPVGFFMQFGLGILAAGTTEFLRERITLKSFKNKWLFDSASLTSLVLAFYLLYSLRHAPEFSYSFQNQPYFYPLFPLLIAITLVCSAHSIRIGKILDNRFFRFTANVSFGLYIWHYFFIYIVSVTFCKDFQYMGVQSPTKWIVIAASIIAVSYGIATISYKYIEKPIIDAAHRRTTKVTMYQIPEN